MMKHLLIFVPGIIWFFIILGCQKNLVQDNEIPWTQFADEVISFSTEYNDAPGPWSSFVILGEPDTYPAYGDLQTAWAPSTKNSQAEFIILGFKNPQYVNEIHIYETFNPGAVAEVQVHNVENDSWEVVFSEVPNNKIKKESRINNISFPLTEFTVDQVKIFMLTDKIDGWNEIDAVSINGFVTN